MTKPNSKIHLFPFLGCYKLDVNVTSIARLITIFLESNIPKDFAILPLEFQQTYAQSQACFLACLIRLAHRYDQKEVEYVKAEKISPLDYYGQYIKHLEYSVGVAIEKAKPVLTSDNVAKMVNVGRLLGELYDPFELVGGKCDRVDPGTDPGTPIRPNSNPSISLNPP